MTEPVRVEIIFRPALAPVQRQAIADLCSRAYEEHFREARDLHSTLVVPWRAGKVW